MVAWLRNDSVNAYSVLRASMIYVSSGDDAGGGNLRKQVFSRSPLRGASASPRGKIGGTYLKWAMSSKKNQR